MKTKKLLAIFTLVLVALIAGCKKDSTTPTGTNPIVIPVQTTV